MLTLQTLPPRLQGLEGDANGAVREGGFSLHAGVDIAESKAPQETTHEIPCMQGIEARPIEEQEPEGSLRSGVQPSTGR